MAGVPAGIGRAPRSGEPVFPGPFSFFSPEMNAGSMSAFFANVGRPCSAAPGVKRLYSSRDTASLSGAGTAAACMTAGSTAARQAAAPLAQRSEASKMNVTERETILIDNGDSPIGRRKWLFGQLDMAVVERRRAA